MDKIVLEQLTNVAAFWHTADGVLVDPSSATCTVYDGAGTEVLASGAATVVGGGSGKTTRAVDLDELDVYSIEWVATVSGDDRVQTTQVEVVGALPVTLEFLRSRYRDLGDTTKHPATELLPTLWRAVERLERAMQVAFTPRARRLTMSGDGSTLLILPVFELTAVYALSVDGVAVSVADLEVESTGLVSFSDGRRFAAGTKNIDVYFEHGWESCPGPVQDAVCAYAAHLAIPDNGAVPTRATTMATDMGQFRLSVAGRDGETGLPEVDAVISSWGYNKPAVG